eukprot:a847163_110.p1 GENE.a847163_110~~a847163_110.p1  ORF type:complete len:146 (-),score=63.46 a847163_110:253-654(-)
MSAFLSAAMGGVAGYFWLKHLQLRELDESADMRLRIVALTKELRSAAGGPQEVAAAAAPVIAQADAPEHEVSERLKTAWNTSVEKVVSGELLPLTDPARAVEKLAADAERVKLAFANVEQKVTSLLNSGTGAK